MNLLSILVRVLVTIACALTVFPFAWMILSSLKGPSEILHAHIVWRPMDGLNWQNYWQVLDRSNFGNLFVNSVAVAAGITLGQLVFGTASGYLLARATRLSRNVLATIHLLSYIVPFQLTWIPSFVLLNHLGLIDTLSSLIIPFLASPLATLLMFKQFQSLPRDFEDAALLDGCKTWSLFALVLLPLVRPGLIALAAFAFLTSWNNLIWPLLMTHHPDVRTLPVGLALFVNEVGPQWHLLMAASVLTTLPAALVMWLLMRNTGTLFGGPSERNTRMAW